MGKVYTRQSLTEQRTTWKQQQKKVVFTNGVFDILHRGHIEYLSQAKLLGDILIVGMNSDASVKRIKGELRPIVREEDRAFILSQLVCVDAVCLFEEDTPLNIISALVPDVLVKGADYTIDAIVGKDVVEHAGGIVRTIEFVPDRSTSNIVETIVSRFSNSK
ncbi:MAG TPA: D-glycero-beta-D-manno-heptose 1-phosphate adenylyltransferase [Bacteroidetes bacterium]|nr:D-glycero-beta-D-manno-heptose 1-phosphate adenylyltransferase [Bacteroidota bacterium]